MASTGGSAHETKMKELDDGMQAISQVLMAAINDEDRVSLNFMLRELKYEKSELQNKQFGDIITAPNTMIFCTVYTKGVRKNNTSTYTNLSLKHCIVKCALYQHYAVFEY